MLSHYNPTPSFAQVYAHAKDWYKRELITATGKRKQFLIKTLKSITWDIG